MPTLFTLLCASGAFAGSIPWTIASTASFAGGATISGSFNYDADANAYSNVLISVGADPLTLTIPADTYTMTDFQADSTSGFLDLFDAGPGTNLQLYFSSPLSDAGGTVATGLHLLYQSEIDFEAGDGSYNTSVSATPEPHAFVLLALGIFTFGVAMRHRGFAVSSSRG